MGYLTLLTWVVCGGLCWDYVRYRHDPMPSCALNLFIIIALAIALTLLSFHVWTTTGELFSLASLTSMGTASGFSPPVSP